MGVANPRVTVNGCSSFWNLNRDLSSAGEPAGPPGGVEGVRMSRKLRRHATKKNNYTPIAQRPLRN